VSCRGQKGSVRDPESLGRWGRHDKELDLDPSESAELWIHLQKPGFVSLTSYVCSW
jgi:hypothetical protein